MKILFYATNQDISLGSYRIWGNDLNQYMQEIGHSSKLYTGSPKEVEEADVIIFAKNDWKDSIKVKEYYPEKIIGTTNLSADISSKVNCDFVIVGSLEEKCSLSKYQNVFLYPLIEKMFQSEDLYKIHEPKDRLTIGFHGSYTHLAKFYPYLYKAIERFDKEQDITLKVITSSGFILVARSISSTFSLFKIFLIQPPTYLISFFSEKLDIELKIFSIFVFFFISKKEVLFLLFIFCLASILFKKFIIFGWGARIRT